jgi:hypothetical protein
MIELDRPRSPSPPCAASASGDTPGLNLDGWILCM